MRGFVGLVSYDNTCRIHSCEIRTREDVQVTIWSTIYHRLFPDQFQRQVVAILAVVWAHTQEHGHTGLFLPHQSGLFLPHQSKLNPEEHSVKSDQIDNYFNFNTYCNKRAML